MAKFTLTPQQVHSAAKSAGYVSGGFSNRAATTLRCPPSEVYPMSFAIKRLYPELVDGEVSQNQIFHLVDANQAGRNVVGYIGQKGGSVVFTMVPKHGLDIITEADRTEATKFTVEAIQEALKLSDVELAAKQLDRPSLEKAAAAYSIQLKTGS
ncbi:MAG: hypothetical protein ACWGQW_08730 [bacterium]